MNNVVNGLIEVDKDGKRDTGSNSSCKRIDKPRSGIVKSLPD